MAEECPNLIGLKDGVGDIELLTALRHRMGDRLIFIGGMPTAEVHASAAAAVGMTTYSSAIYNFAPDMAPRFFDALRAGRTSEVGDLVAPSSCPISPSATGAPAMPSRSSRLVRVSPGLIAGRSGRRLST